MDDNTNVQLHYELNYIPALNRLYNALNVLRSETNQHSINLNVNHSAVIELNKAHQEFMEQLNILDMIKKLSKTW